MRVLKLSTLPIVIFSILALTKITSGGVPTSTKSHERDFTTHDTARNLAPIHRNNEQFLNELVVVDRRVARDLAPLSTRRNISTNAFYDWQVVYTNITTFLPSRDAVNSLKEAYSKMASTIIDDVATLPVNYLSIAFGALNFTCSAITKSIQWQIARDFLRLMYMWATNGFPMLGNIVFQMGKMGIVWFSCYVVLAAGFDIGADMAARAGGHLIP